MDADIAAVLKDAPGPLQQARDRLELILTTGTDTQREAICVTLLTLTKLRPGSHMIVAIDGAAEALKAAWRS